MVTLVLLPGMDGTGDLFERFVAALGSEFNVKVVSYPATEPLGYSELESIARAALPGEGPFVILGESFSGPIAISLAASCSSRLKGLVLCCSFVRNPRPAFSALKPFIGLLPWVLAPARVLSYRLFGRSTTSATRMALMHAHSRVSRSVLCSRVRSVLSIDVSAKLSVVSVPVLYLRASQDHVVPRRASKLVSELCPSAKVVQLEGPHFLLQAVPSGAARVVSAFIREVENVP
jgi:pimeloyl-[acyl-carrier protein] methyl ester esterase